MYWSSLDLNNPRKSTDMANVTAIQNIENKTTPATTETKSQGSIKAVHYAGTEDISQGVSDYLEKINKEQTLPENTLGEHTFTQVNPEIEAEIFDLLLDLQATEAVKDGTQDTNKTTTQKKTTEPQVKHEKEASASTSSNPKETKTVYSSLFSMANSMNKERAQQRQQLDREPARPEHKSPLASASPALNMRDTPLAENRAENQNKERDDEQGGGFGGNKREGGQQEQKKQKEKKQGKEGLKIKASRSVSSSRTTHMAATPHIQSSSGGIENIYIRFMALMARILGQAEAEGHALYLRIKERTDNVDALTLFVSKINSEKGNIDWSKNEELKQLVDKARALGVDIPAGKYQWTEEEKKLLKENVQMRKDSMEKITQLERTDMQRYLQEASQCHQARSNVLKLMKEVMDVIIHNMKP